MVTASFRDDLSIWLLLGPDVRSTDVQFSPVVVNPARITVTDPGLSTISPAGPLIRQSPGLASGVALKVAAWHAPFDLSLTSEHSTAQSVALETCIVKSSLLVMIALSQRIR